MIEQFPRKVKIKLGPVPHECFITDAVTGEAVTLVRRMELIVDAKSDDGRVTFMEEDGRRWSLTLDLLADLLVQGGARYRLEEGALRQIAGDMGFDLVPKAGQPSAEAKASTGFALPAG